MILIKTLLKGLFIGASMLIPGVSGGSVAIYLGIYEKIIDSVANFKKNFKKNIVFLLLLLIGAALSVIILSGSFNILFSKLEKQLCIIVGIVFIGLSIQKLYKNKYCSKIKGIVLTSSGILFPALILLVPENSFNINNEWQIFVVSLFLSLALILPGISFSYCLFIFGIYQNVLQSIYALDISFILIFSGGLLIGILTFTKLIDSLMKNNTEEFNCCINGFVLFSSFEILPLKYIISNHYSIFYVIIGLLIFFLIKNFSKKQGAK